MIVSSNPQLIAVDNNWVRKNVIKFGIEVQNSDVEDIIAEWCYDDFVIKVVEYSNTVLWAALFNNKVVGAGSFTCYSFMIKEGIQAVLPKYQKRGIYTSIIEFMVEWAGPLNIESDDQQTAEMQRLWYKFTKMNDVYESGEICV